jgi:hypothetical protein
MIVYEKENTKNSTRKTKQKNKKQLGYFLFSFPLIP